MEDLVKSVITLELLTGEREGWRIVALITDVSPTGLFVQVDGELAVGTRVRLEYSSGGSTLGIVQAVEPVDQQCYSVAIRTTVSSSQSAS